MAPKKKQKLEETKEDEDMKTEVKEEDDKAEVEVPDQDAPKDTRKKIGEPVRFLPADMTANAVQGTIGNMLMTVKDGAMQYLHAGVRGTVGMKSGRYAFEAKIIEALNPAPVAQAAPQGATPKQLLRVGFSTAGGDLILGHGDDNFCFDETGVFMHNAGRAVRPLKGKAIFATDNSIVLVLNLDKGVNSNTVSLFVDGERVGQPHAIPDALKGQALYPTLTFKNVTVYTNFAEIPEPALPFKCRMLEDAAAADVVVAAAGQPGELEILFPICLPDQGTFDWCAWYTKEHPSKGYLEVSDKAIHDWAINSGLKNSKALSKKGTNDAPDMGFNITSMDDGSVKDTLHSLANMQSRNILVMEVKSNLVKEEREHLIEKWSSVPGKKIAQVMLGRPEEGFRKQVQAAMLVEKQEKLTKEFEIEQAMKQKRRVAEERRKAILRAARKAAMIKQQKEAELKQEADLVAEAIAEAERKRKAEEDPDGAGAAEAEAAAAAEAEAAGETIEKKEEEVVKEEEKKEEELPESEDEKMEEPEEEAKPPVATLTLVEQQVYFAKVTVGDVSPAIIAASFGDFSLPDESEGFDEIRFTWSSKEESEEHLRKWVSERKLTTRIEDLKPSDWFREKWAEWQKNLQSWHVKHMEAKDPAKARDNAANVAKLGATAKAAPEKSPAEKDAEEKKDGEQKKKEEEEVDENKDPMAALEEELDREDIDIFAVEDVSNHDGQGTPLYSSFAFEDWALLSLRFELHLLAHAFRIDANDPDRTGIHPEHLPFYYNKYYKKGLNPKNYGVETVEELVELVKDTTMADVTSKVVESMVGDELESNDIFVKLTEESRRDRQRRVDAGEEGAKLKFSRPTGGPGAAVMNAAAPPVSGRPGATALIRPGAVAATGTGIKPKVGASAFPKLQATTLSYGNQGGAFNGVQGGMRPQQWGGGLRPVGQQMGMNNMGVNTMGMNNMGMQQRQGQWNQNFGSMWGNNWNN